MQRETCDYETAMGRVLGQEKPLNTIYYDKWYELLPKVKTASKADAETRKNYDKEVKLFSEQTPSRISYADMPWPCEGTAEEMVAAMLAGEADKASTRRRIKELALFWHPDKLFSRFANNLCPEDQEQITDGVMSISKQISTVLEKERD